MTRPRGWAWIVFCCAAILLPLVPARITDPVRLTVLSALRPVDRAARALEGLASWPVGQIRSESGDTPSSDEVAALRTALVRSEDEKARLRQMLTGLAELRRSPISQQPRLIAANVLLGRDTSDWRNSLVLDRGTADGVAVGCPVVCGKVLVGRIRAVAPTTSEVQCLTDPEFEVACTIASLSEAIAPAAPAPSPADAPPAEGIAHGREGPSMCGVKWVERHRRVRAGDLVLASGTGSQALFDGLLLGTVTRASTAETGFYYRIDVQPQAALGRLREVFILQRPVQAAVVPPRRKGK